MLRLLRLLFGLLVRTITTRNNLLLENLVLRQQVAILKRIHPQPGSPCRQALLGIVEPALARLEEGVAPD